MKSKKPAARGAELAVLEGKWWDEKNTSVRSIFDVLSDLMVGSTHGYYYEMFSGSDSLEGIVRRVGSWNAMKFIYIGAHGDEKGVYGSLGPVEGWVSRTKVRNAILRLNGVENAKVYGLYFGSCSFLTAANAEFILTSTADDALPSIKWVAGYSDVVDWIDSTIVDLYFFRHLMDAEGTSLERVKHTANLVRENLPLAATLGFQVYVRSKSRNGYVVSPLINWGGEDC